MFAFDRLCMCPPIEMSDNVTITLFPSILWETLGLACFSNFLFWFSNVIIIGGGNNNKNKELVNIQGNIEKCIGKWLLLPVVELNPSYLAMAIFTNTFDPECFLLSPTMPRRILQAEEASSSSMDLQTSASHRDSGVFFFLGGIVVLIILLVIVFIIWMRMKRQAKVVENAAPITEKHELMKIILPNKQQSGPMEFISGNLRTISYFDFRTLRRATKNFHPRNLLGSGGFGPVYQGKLADGRLIAVKTLSLDKSQQGEKEFLAEVRMITSIQHKNLVRLLGCCTDGPQRILVYEYMKNRSLDLLIYGKSDQFLNWSTRFQIILGVARGLQYLHEDSHLRIVHRDIKASNILLDEKFQPRIGDFGLARFFPEDQAYLSTQFAGTLGYTAPEYAIRGELSEKADIYSFGVLVLEIISCRKNTDLTLPSEMQYLPEYAWKLYEKSTLMEIVDPKLREHDIKEKDVMQAFHVALLCLQPHADLRPAMSEIVAMLTFKLEMVRTPMRPNFVDRRRVMDDENHSWEAISEALTTAATSDSASSHKAPIL